MKKFFRFFKKPAVLAVITFLDLQILTTPANAQIADLVAAINRVRTSIEALVQTAGQYIFQTSPNAAPTIETNYARNNSTGVPVTTQVQQNNLADIKYGILPDVTNPGARLTELSSILAEDIVVPDSSSFQIPTWLSGGFTKATDLKKALVDGDANFNIQSLINPRVYSSKNQQNYASNFIKFISGYVAPISNLSLKDYDFSGLSESQKNQVIQNIQNDDTYKLFMVQRRAIVALQTAALTQLYQVYSRRLPITSIKAGDTALNMDSPSALQIEDHISNWRTSTPYWYQQMETSPPTTIARETLYVLAEIQRELHSIRSDNERMLVILSINQLGGLTPAKMALKGQETSAKQTIDKEIADAKQRILKESRGGT